MKYGYQESLRRLAIVDEGFLSSAGLTLGDPEPSGLKMHALVQLAASIAVGSESYVQRGVDDALVRGAVEDEVVGVLIAVAPVVGASRTASAARDVAVRVGYDVDAALEDPEA